jgi:hypothetical protein
MIHYKVSFSILRMVRTRQHIEDSLFEDPCLGSIVGINDY